MVNKTTQCSQFQNHVHFSSIAMVVKTCMFLPAVKSVVKRGTNPIPLFKDMEDSPRLGTDSGQTLIGFVLQCTVLMRYCQRWNSSPIQFQY